MATHDPSQNIHRLAVDGKSVIIVGTAHVSKESAELVAATIAAEKPDTVCIELCPSRFQSIQQKNRWQDMDIIKVIKEKKAMLLLANLMLAAFQKRIAQKLEIQPGQEMITAIASGEAIGAHIHLVDRDIRTTLLRAFREMGLWEKTKLTFQLLLSFGEIDEIDAETVEKMKEADVLESLLAEVGESHPILRSILIDERDQYLSHKIKNAPGNTIVAVVGAGHVPGIQRYWDQSVDMAALDVIPPKRKLTRIIQWLLPTAIIGMVMAGFFVGGKAAGTHMAASWIMAHGIMAGVGATCALANPFTIVSAVVASPMTALNPMIAAGWVSGLVEAVSRKPKVRDFEALADDIKTISGFWKNKVTRILLVVVFTNIGSALGTFVAIPLMMRFMG